MPGNVLEAMSPARRRGGLVLRRRLIVCIVWIVWISTSVNVTGLLSLTSKRTSPLSMQKSFPSTSARRHTELVTSGTTSTTTWMDRDGNTVRTTSTIHSRRDWINSCFSACGCASGMVLWKYSPPAQAIDSADTSPKVGSGVYTREVPNQFRYIFQPPPNFPGPGQKPLKTHLDEVNFISPDVPGYQFGITVDPVRISSLVEFGTPEEVAAKVVMAEVNRDGVFTVTLMEDPVSITDDTNASSNSPYYQLNYVSTGTRGTKRFIARFYIQNQKLFALTAQCKEDNFPKVQPSMVEAVNSFRVLP